MNYSANHRETFLFYYTDTSAENQRSAVKRKGESSATSGSKPKRSKLDNAGNEIKSGRVRHHERPVVKPVTLLVPCTCRPFQ